VIPDGNPLVVRQERMVGAEHASDVRGVLDRCVEVRVVADLRGQSRLDFRGRQEELAREPFGATADVRVVTEQVHQSGAEGAATPRSAGHEGVQRPTAARLRRHPGFARQHTVRDRRVER
jgi:hypothetical protein